MKPLASLHLSDCHLGASRLDSISMCAGIYETVAPWIPKVQLIDFTGDVFDKALGMSDAFITDICDLLVAILRLADKHDVVVRVLRGTFSHDRTQSKWFEFLHKNSGFTNDLRYFDTISLEYIERFDMRVLYLPDDLPFPSSDAVIAHVKDMMKKLNWDTVDYVFMHGSFDYALPDCAKPTVCYRREQFDFVTRFINIGHIHHGSILDNFIYNGSTDRLGHGEEEAKGVIYINDSVKTAKIKFIENKNATLFDTYQYAEDMGEEEVLKDLIEKIEKKYPKDQRSYVRLKHPSSDFRAAIGAQINRIFPHIVFTHMGTEKTASKRSEILLAMPEVKQLTAPTPQTLPNLVFDHLLSKGVSLPPGLDEAFIRKRLQEVA